MNSVMSYTDARKFIQSGDIIFIRNKGTRLHRLISYFTHSDHIHVGIAFWTIIGSEQHLMISEINGGAQRRVVNLSYCQDHDMDVLATKHEWLHISERALAHLGQVRYSWIEAGYVGINEALERTFNISLPYINFSGEICSEFVANVLELEHNYLSPAKLYLYMVNELEYETRVRIRV